QSSSTPSAADIVKSFSGSSKKRKKNVTSALTHSQKIPKLSSLSVSQASIDDNSQMETSLLLPQSRDTGDTQNETINDNTDEQEEETQAPKRRRGRKKK